MATSVLVTSYRRPDRLAACLEGLRTQTRAPDEVVVAVHSSDRATVDSVAKLTSTWAELRCVELEEHGSVAALNHGLAAARGTIIAVIDDDAVPTADWLERIAATFERDERIAAVGGRDLLFSDAGMVRPPRPRRLPATKDPADDVGRIQWFGRMIGNHHFGAGAARDVDVLKGANMSLRRRAVAKLGYDERLRGQGAIVHTEMSVCLPLRQRGHRVVYDPSIVVHHYPSPRPHGDHRDDAGFEAVLVAAHNEALAILDYFGPARRLVYAAWWCAVGTTDAPGLAVVLRDALAGRPAPWMKFLAAQRGRAAAWRSHRQPRRVPAPLAGPARPGSRVAVPAPPRAAAIAARLDGSGAAAPRTKFGDHIAVLTDGSQDPGLATLINSLVRNGFDGTIWLGRRGPGTAFLDELPASVGDRVRVRVIELETKRPLTYYKADFLQSVWAQVEPDATSVVYMDCDLVLGCDWAFVHAWVATGLAVVEDLPGRLVGANHPLRAAWRSVMVAAGTPPVREVGEYFNAGFVGVPAHARAFLPVWSAFASALEGLPGVRDPSNSAHFVVGVRSRAQGFEVSSDAQALMRPFFLEDQDALNMAMMASTVPISAMGPNAMGFTGDRTAIVPHAIGREKPWTKRYLRKLILTGEGPTFADDAWWRYSGHPIPVACGWRFELRRLSWRAAKILARVIG